MPTRGYSSYHGRRSLWRVLLVLLLILLLLAAGAFLLLQDYIVYESNGAIRLELPPLPWGDGTPAEAGDAAPLPEDGGAAEDLPPVVILPGDEPEAQPPEPLRAPVLTAGALCDAALLQEAAEGGNGVLVELKGDDGVFYYTSGQALKGAAAPSAVTQSQLTSALSAQEGLYAVAAVSCFHDSAYAFSNMAGAGVCQPNGYIWYDYQNSHWLDPAKEEAGDYLLAVAAECAAMGFDEVLLTQFHYPIRGKLYKIDYSKMTVTKEDALCAFLTRLREALGEEVAVAVEIDLETLLSGGNADAGVDLPRLLPLVDHICVSAGDREAEALEALRAAGAEEPEQVILWRREGILVSAAAE